MARRLAHPVVLLVALATTAASFGATRLLERVLLSPAQVGDGYQMRLLEGGNIVKDQVSLDLCGFRFPSERLRTGRLQVLYLHGGGVTQISNEVVSYRPGGARQVMKELQRAVKTCPAAPVRAPVQGAVPIAHRLTRIRDARLLRPYVAVLDRNTATVNGKRLVKWAVSVYQIRGNVLSAIYTDATGTIAAQQRVALHAAREAAENLRRSIP